MLTFPITLFGSGLAATRTHTYSADSAAGPTANNYTFTGASLGTASNTSLVVVVAYMWSNGTSPAISSISIDGANGALIQSLLTTDAVTYDMSIAIASRATSNTSGDIITRANNGSVRGRIDVWRINDLQSATAFDSAKQGAISANASISLNIPSAGVTIAAAGTLNPGDATVPTMTGLTQDANGVLAINLYKWVYGSDQNMSAQTGLSITSVKNTGALPNSLVGASWQ